MSLSMFYFYFFILFILFYLFYLFIYLFSLFELSFEHEQFLRIGRIFPQFSELCCDAKGISGPPFLLQLSKNGFSYVLVAKCLFTRYTFLRPIMTKTANNIAQALLEIFTAFGSPSIIISDNGTEFKNVIVKSLDELLKISHTFTVPYNPRTNGSAERASF